MCTFKLVYIYVSSALVLKKKKRKFNKIGTQVMALIGKYSSGKKTKTTRTGEVKLI